MGMSIMNNRHAFAYIIQWNLSIKDKLEQLFNLSTAWREVVHSSEVKVYISTYRKIYFWCLTECPLWGGNFYGVLHWESPLIEVPLYEN